MGFTLKYRTTRAITVAHAKAIRESLVTLNDGRSWLRCEPVNLRRDIEDGCLVGASKPSLTPHPDDVASAAAGTLPDGTVRDLIGVLCELSNLHQIDWEFSHDYEPGPIGYIRDGVCEQRLIEQIDALIDLTEMMHEYDTAQLDFPVPEATDAPSRVDDDDGEPTLLPFRPRT